jgi:hypothetical protein
METSSPEQEPPNAFRNKLFGWAFGLTLFGVYTAYRTRGYAPSFAPYGLLFSTFAGAVFCLRGGLRLWTPLTEDDYQPRPFPFVDSILSWLILALLVSGFIAGVVTTIDVLHRPSYDLFMAALLSFPLPVFAYVAWKKMKEAIARV